MTDTQPAPPPSRAPVAWYNALLGVAMLVAFALYLPAIYGPWLHDDVPQIVRNPSVQIHSITLDGMRDSTSEFPSRPIAMMSFAANHAMCGLNPSCYKATNIVLHALTALALLGLLVMLRRVVLARTSIAFPVWLPAMTAALWLLHPLQVSTTLYVVQRMTQLVTLGSFAALALYIHGRFLAPDARARARSFVLATLAFALALASKENAVLVIPEAIVVELLVLRDAQRARLRERRVTFPLLGGGALLLLVALVLGWHRIAADYVIRDFTPMERLLTEARLLTHYAANILCPDYSDMPFFLDGMPISRGWLDPWTTLPAVLLWIGLVTGALFVLWRRPSLVAFGILFFVCGHLLESTILGLALGYEHRNYGPLAGLLLAALAMLAAAPFAAGERGARLTAIILAAAMSVALFPRVQAWSSEDAFTDFLGQHATGSAMAQNYIGHHYYQLQDDQGRPDYDADYETIARRHMTLAAEMSAQPFVSLAQLLIRPATPTERDHQWDLMMRAARDQPPSADMISAMQVFIGCFVFSEGCPVSPARYQAWIELALKNPRLRHSWRTEMERLAAGYYVRATDKHARGIELSRLAAASGRPEARESLIKNLAIVGQIGEARALYEAWKESGSLPADRRARLDSALSETSSTETAQRSGTKQ